MSECTGDNIFIVKDNELLTPAPYHGALDGITMRTVMEIAESLGFRTRETTLTRYDPFYYPQIFFNK